MAERLWNRATNHKVAGSILSHAKLRCVLGQGTSPYLPRGECPCTYCKSLWIRASAKCKCLRPGDPVKRRVLLLLPLCELELGYLGYDAA